MGEQQINLEKFKQILGEEITNGLQGIWEDNDYNLENAYKDLNYLLPITTNNRYFMKN